MADTVEAIVEITLAIKVQIDKAESISEYVNNLYAKIEHLAFQLYCLFQADKLVGIADYAKHLGAVESTLRDIQALMVSEESQGFLSKLARTGENHKIFEQYDKALDGAYKVFSIDMHLRQDSRKPSTTAQGGEKKRRTDHRDSSSTTQDQREEKKRRTDHRDSSSTGIEAWLEDFGRSQETQASLEILQSAIVKLKQGYIKRWQHDELDQLANFYVPLNGQMSDSKQAVRHDLAAKISDFLQSRKKVCLLLGHAGSGKTSYGQMLERALWTSHENQDKSSTDDAMLSVVSTESIRSIPIRLELKGYDRESAKRCVENSLCKQGLKDPEIEALKRSEHAFTFILDGLDELSGGGMPCLYRENELSTWGKGSHTIIGCRVEYVSGQSNYKAILGPGGEQGQLSVDEWYVAPLNDDQVGEYLNKQEKSGQLEESQATYEAFIKATEGLKELIDSPFLLKVFLSAYPRLKAQIEEQTQSDESSGQGKKSNARRITRSDLYEAFMWSWFEREEGKLLDSLGKDLTEIDFKASFSAFSQELALAMYGRGINEVAYRERQKVLWSRSRTSQANKVSNSISAQADADLWDTFFSKKDEKATLARRGSPLRCMSGKDDQGNVSKRYSFIHQSFLEYFIAMSLWEAMEGIDTSNPETITRAQEVWGLRLLSTDPEGKVAAMPVVINFVSERLRYDGSKKALKDKLYSLVKGSKVGNTKRLSKERSKEAILSASNAMTVLNFALESFAQKDLEEPGIFKGIQIPGAWIQAAELSGVDLSGSDLSHCHIKGIKLHYAKLDGCKLSNIHHPENPVLKVSGGVKDIALSPCGTQMAVATGKVIKLYARKGIQWQHQKTLEGHSDGVRCISYSPDGKSLATGGWDGRVRLWGLDGRAIAALEGHRGEVRCISYSPDGKSLATGGNDRTVRLWRRDEGGNWRQVWQAPRKGDMSAVNSSMKEVEGLSERDELLFKQLGAKLSVSKSKSSDVGQGGFFSSRVEEDASSILQQEVSQGASKSSCCELM